MSGPSLRTVIDRKCRRCGAADEGSRWRETITISPLVDYPLWAVRPISRYVPDLLARRNVAALSFGWINQSEDEPLRQLRNRSLQAPRDTETGSCNAKPEIGEAIHLSSGKLPAEHQHGVMAAVKLRKAG